MQSRCSMHLSQPNSMAARSPAWSCHISQRRSQAHHSRSSSRCAHTRLPQHRRHHHQGWACRAGTARCAHPYPRCSSSSRSRSSQHSQPRKCLGCRTHHYTSAYRSTSRTCLLPATRCRYPSLCYKHSAAAPCALHFAHDPTAQRMMRCPAQLTAHQHAPPAPHAGASSP